jgi:hypothetical protein
MNENMTIFCDELTGGFWRAFDLHFVNGTFRDGFSETLGRLWDRPINDFKHWIDYQWDTVNDDLRQIPDSEQFEEEIQTTKKDIVITKYVVDVWFRKIMNEVEDYYECDMKKELEECEVYSSLRYNMKKSHFLYTIFSAANIWLVKLLYF